MIGNAMGAPLAYGALPFELPVLQIGNYEDGDGVRITIKANNLVMDCQFGEIQAEFGLSIDALLEAIQEYNHEVGS